MTIFAVEYSYATDTTGIRDEHRPAHRQWLRSLAEEGTVLSAGAYADGTGALLLFSAGSEEELMSLLGEDPFAMAGGVSGMRATAWKPAIGAFVENA